MSRIRRIEEAFAREQPPEFSVGDTVDVHVLIREGDKDRVQVFNGTVIRKRGAGMSATYTVRRIVQGQGIERIFPLHSPFVQKVVVKRKGKVRRSRLYYLRQRKGKATRLKEIITIREPKPAQRPTPRPAVPDVDEPQASSPQPVRAAPAGEE